MKYRHAKRLHNGDEVLYQGRPARVLSVTPTPRENLPPVVLLELTTEAAGYVQTDHWEVQ